MTRHSRTHQTAGAARPHSERTFNYARPWQVFLGVFLLVCCIWTTLDVAKNYRDLSIAENYTYTVDDIDGVTPEVEQVSPDWGFFKRIIKKVVRVVKKVVKAVVRTVRAVINVAAVYLGLARCTKQSFPLYPIANPWDMGVVQQANYEKPVKGTGVSFARGPAQRYLNRMGSSNMVALDSKDINQWRLLLVYDKRTGLLYVCFRGSTTWGNWVNNFRKFFQVGTGRLNRIYRQMNAQVVYWRRRYPRHRIYGFIGHSAGGWYANQVLVNWDVWRITLNAYDMSKRGRRYVNFRTMKDPVSALKSLSSYACLGYCKKGHSNVDFINCWRHRYGRYRVNDYKGRWCATYGSFCRARNGAPARYTPPSGRNAAAPRGGILNARGGPGLQGRQAPVARTTGWTKVFQCWRSRNRYGNRWYWHPNLLVERARSNWYQIQFVDPHNRRRWAMSSPVNKQWSNNLARGKALSYVPNGVNNYGWAKRNVATSYNSLQQNFAYTCNNNRLPGFPRNIYWACGNGRNGFHLIPGSWCTWSWPQRYRNQGIEMWVYRLATRPQGTPVNTRGWQQVFKCANTGRLYKQRWFVSPGTLINRAKTFKYAFLWVNGRNKREWATSSSPFFWNNLRFGRALSYNGRYGLSRAWVNRNIRASQGPLREHFAFGPPNNRYVRLTQNLYWARGNGQNGLHLMPALRICRWNWRGGNEQKVQLWVRVIGRVNRPRRRRRSSS